MDLKLGKSHLDKYTSNSQIARVLTEAWVKSNVFCPACGNNVLDQFGNNSPVADFLCKKCNSEYELKSKKDAFSMRIVDGAYKTMIERINADNNPHFFFLNYSLQNLEVQNFLVIPKHYFVNDIIEERKPLAVTARRAGWIGCNILLKEIPSSGKIYFVKDGKPYDRRDIINNWAKTAFLETKKGESRGWLIEIMKTVEKILGYDFNLSDVYKFEKDLKLKFPNNNFIKDKIRQQLQLLRDKGIIEFKGNGSYKKVL